MRKILVILLMTCFFAKPTFAQSQTASASSQWLCPGSYLQLYYSGGIPNSVWERQSYSSQEWESFSSADQTVNMLVPIPSDLGFMFRVKSPNGNGFLYSNTLFTEYPESIFDPAGIQGIGRKCMGDNTAIQLSLAGNYGPYTNILWSTGATTPSITVNPTTNTEYKVTSTDRFGCVAITFPLTITIFPLTPPVIQATSLGSICGGGQVTLSFGGFNTSTPCTLSPNGQYPATAVTALPGQTDIVSDGHPGEYSVINVVEGRFYNFFSRPLVSNNAAYSTITSADGSQVYISGFYGTALWRATYTGQVRFYSNELDCNQSNNSGLVARWVICNNDGSGFGPFLWMPGGQTTPSITVNPSSTTNYTLKVGTGMYINNYVPCPGSSSMQVIIGIGSVELTTTNITSNSAKLNWTSAYSPDEWQLRYKTTANGSKWIETSVAGNLRSYVASPLLNNQNYMWQIRGKCGKSWTDYSNTLPFITGTQATTMNRSAVIPEKELGEVDKLQLVAMPNPSNTNFKIMLGSNDLKEPVKLIVSDMLGRIIETRITTSGQVITIGDQYRSGTYILRLIQGNEVRQLKLIKLLN